jgi:rSAM/selenodomain-associated transferase 1
MKGTLVLFARAPRLGVGKRRLARDIGAVAALRFERLMLARSLRRLGCDRRWRLVLAITPDREALRLGAMPQGRGDLGTRMRQALNAAGSGPVVLVGSDIPALTSMHIETAFSILKRYDVVFGPARDGGFWLAGARHRMPDFGQVRWSSPHALADVLVNLPKSLSVGFVTVLEDVDDGVAYRRLGPIRGF